MSARLSLWLIPPPSSAQATKLANLLSTTIPSLFPHIKLPRFAPHVTLATGIDASTFAGELPESWLDARDFSKIDAEDVKVDFEGVKVGETFTKKCYLQVSKSGDLVNFAVQLLNQVYGPGREEEVYKMVVTEWDPHLSLLYWDGGIEEEKLKAIKKIVDGDGKDHLHAPTMYYAWTGGFVQLVDTSKPVEEWKVLAERSI